MKNNKILLVEDNDAHAKLTKLAFESECQGYSLIHIDDGQKAIDWLEEQKEEGLENMPKFILLDLNIPSLNGISVLEKIKKDEFLQLIPTIILTTSTSNNDIKACYVLNANSYIVKPLVYNDFLSMVNILKEYWIDTNTSIDVKYLQ